MPPRLFVGAILAFWLAMTGWLIQREVVPMMLADMSPSYQPDLTDELGSKLVAWTVLRGGKRAGSATSRVVPAGDRTFEIHSTFHFDHTFLNIRQLESMERIDEEKKLKAFSVKIVLENEHKGEIRGEVVNNQLKPQVFFNGVENKFFDWGTIDMSKQRAVLNPMNLVSRLKGLHDGQTWKIPLLDPFQGIKSPLVGDLIKPLVAAPPELIATVSIDTLKWNREEVECYKVEYHETGKDPTGRTWVRRSDGAVLRQEFTHLDFDLVLQRVP